MIEDDSKLAGTACASDGAAVADLIPRLGETYRTLVQNLERMPPRYVDRARTTLKRLVGEIRLVPDGGALTAEFELEGARCLRPRTRK